MNQELAARFQNPPAEDRAQTFWAWNGELSKDELLRQLTCVKEMGMGGFFMHSRAGLATEYLGEKWFGLINSVADAAAELGLSAWLYDEDRWPSGSAGGMVTADARFRMKSLVLTEAPDTRAAADAVLLYAAQLDGMDLKKYRRLDTAADFAACSPAAGWRLLALHVVPDAPSSAYNGNTYIDTMNAEATARFIALTHSAYKAHAGTRMGTSIPGIFTDEPHRGHCLDDLTEADGVRRVSMCYTDDFFAEFSRRKGYDARDVLPELYYTVNGSRVAPIKRDYVDVANALFLARFAEPLNRWCTENGIFFTGHVLHENTLSNQTVPNGSLMRFYEHMSIPGVDVLTAHVREYWVVKQLSSVARQTGKTRMLSELYGCTGWNFSLRGHKRVGDWQALFGINLRCPHLSWYTMEGEAKRDYPASIFYQSAWYDDYRLIEDYFARFGQMMRQGQPICDVLVINPIESVWCQIFMGWAKWIYNQSDAIEQIEQMYAETFHALIDQHIDFDYGEEEMLSRLAHVETDETGACLVVGQARYRTVLVSGMLTMRKTTLSQLVPFLQAGGRVVLAGEAPAYLEARPSDAVKSALTNAVHVPLTAAALANAVRGARDARVLNAITGAEETRVYCQMRQTANAIIVALLNMDDASDAKIRLILPTSTAVQVQKWDLLTGARSDFSHYANRESGSLTIRLTLLPAQSQLLVLTPDKEALPRQTEWRDTERIPVSGAMAYSLSEDNVLPLDYAEWKFDDDAWQGRTEVLKIDNAIRDRLGLERRGGEMLQPWFAKNYQNEVRGTLSLRFTATIAALPVSACAIAMERPELFTITVNGVPIAQSKPNSFCVDPCFVRLPIPAGLLRPGENEICLTTAFRRTSNVEAIYLLGAFGVHLKGPETTVIPLPRQLDGRALAEQGLPFYGAKVCLHLPTETLRAAAARLRPGMRAVVRIPHFAGALVEVHTRLAQTNVAFEPYEAEITEALAAGEAIDITFVATRRNTFGPLHIHPAEQTAIGPMHFVTEGDAWTDEYSLLPSGLGDVEIALQKNCDTAENVI